MSPRLIPDCLIAACGTLRHGGNQIEEISMTARTSQELSTRQRSKPRTAAQLDSSIEKKLLGYATLAAASGVGILALGQPAAGEVVFTPTHQRIGHDSTLALDLNGDGVVDFTFSCASFSGGAVRVPGAKTYTFNSDAEMLVFGVAKSNHPVGGQQEYNGRFVSGASALMPGVEIGPNAKFGTSNIWMGGISATDSEPARYWGPWAPEGGNVKGRYVGFEFVVNGEIHYGWARFNVQMRQPRHGKVQAVLTGYAYETEPNTPIETGRVKGPESAESKPGTLGGLALGAAGR
jgi:hypothetical protein